MPRKQIAAAFALLLVTCATAGSQPATATADSVSDRCVLMPLYVGGLPVLTCHPRVRVGPQLDPLPVTTYAAGTVVPVSGNAIVAGQQVAIDGQWSPILAAADGSLGFILPREARAGTDVARLGAGQPPLPLAAAFPQRLVVRPSVARATFSGDKVEVVIEPAAEAGQNVTVDLTATDGSPVSIHVPITPDEATSDLSVPLPAAFPSGTYLAGVTVDGVASLPRTDPAGGAGPQVRVTGVDGSAAGESRITP